MDSGCSKIVPVSRLVATVVSKMKPKQYSFKTVYSTVGKAVICWTQQTKSFSLNRMTKNETCAPMIHGEEKLSSDSDIISRTQSKHVTACPTRRLHVETSFLQKRIQCQNLQSSQYQFALSDSLNVCYSNGSQNIYWTVPKKARRLRKDKFWNTISQDCRVLRNPFHNLWDTRCFPSFGKSKKLGDLRFDHHWKTDKVLGKLLHTLPDT